MSSELFNQVVIGIVGIVGALITAFVIPYLKTRISSQNLAMINSWVTIAVRAAEQIYKDAEDAGLIKYEYVVNFLKEKGISVNEAELKNLIESEVLKL